MEFFSHVRMEPLTHGYSLVLSLGCSYVLIKDTTRCPLLGPDRTRGPETFYLNVIY